MAWSLSQDDDGLEPIVGSTSTSMDGRRRTPLHGLVRTVFIDPLSQVPPPSSQQLPSSQHRRGSVVPQSGTRKVTEPTLVLQRRQVDSLRAEVLRHQKALAHQKRLSTIFWTLAGAAAVLAGAFLARTLSGRQHAWAEVAVPLEKSATTTALVPERAGSEGSTSASQAESTSEVRVPRTPGESEAKVLPPVPSDNPDKAPRRSSLSLDELPTE